jgi:hypothetical protein
MMDKIEGEIRFGWQDQRINDLLRKGTPESGKYTLHYNQNEEFFLKLEAPFTVPHFPIHHDVDKKQPSEKYQKSLLELMQQIITLTGPAFSGLTYAFDPAEIFRPFFFQIYRLKEELFLYLLRLDLQYRPNDGAIIRHGSNDQSHTYETNKLFLEADLIPLSGLTGDKGKIYGCTIDQIVSQTWIGESGRGYIIQGIWIDNDLTKFFSRLLLPEHKRSYPYYPFSCKHRTICHTLLNLSPEGRKRHLQLAFHAKPFLKKHINTMQNVLKKESFSQSLPAFGELKKQVPAQWDSVWTGLTVEPYLNEKDMKEFIVEFT